MIKFNNFIISSIIKKKGCSASIDSLVGYVQLYLFSVVSVIIVSVFEVFVLKELVFEEKDYDTVHSNSVMSFVDLNVFIH